MGDLVQVARLQKEMEQANETYKEGVNRLEQLRVAWEEDMELAATLFEGLEMKRVNSAKVRRCDSLAACGPPLPRAVPPCHVRSRPCRVRSRPCRVWLPPC